MRQKKNDSIWIVVYVFRGMPARIRIFRQAQHAYSYEHYLRKRINPDYDETGVFVINRWHVNNALKGKPITLNALGL